MASYQSFKACPQCGGVLLLDMDTHTGIMHAFCGRCGLTAQVSRWRNAAEVDEEYSYVVQENPGYGSISLVLKDGIAYKGALRKPFSDKSKRSFEASVRQENVDASKSYMTRWNENSRQVIAVYGKIPPTFEEWEKLNR